jgi:endonuclease-3
VTRLVGLNILVSPINIKMDKKYLQELLRLLRKKYKNSKTALNYRTPHQMLVATILSAQCTDDRVNKVTKDLFNKYKNVDDFAKVKQSELEQDIRSTGFFRNKAKNIIGSAKVIVDEFNGKVPKKMGNILKLPGVARKTANVVLHNAYGIVDGVVVDTHVGRLSRRLGLSNQKNAEKVEQDLMAAIPKKDWANISYWLIDHGRAVCKSQKPVCNKCLLSKTCPSAFKFNKKGKWTGVK